MTHLKEDEDWFWLCNIPGIANKKIEKLLGYFKSPGAIRNATYSQLDGARKYLPIIKDTDIENILSDVISNEIKNNYNYILNEGIGYTYYGRYDYPKSFYSISDAPFIIYYKGKLPDSNIPSVAIVGSRNCSEYGKAIAVSLARGFSNMGLQVISGMALGVDSYSHLGAMDNGGKTFAVLGCGVDICYPRSNIELYMNIQRSGGILSEYACNTPPVAGLFPRRNRIISALSDAVVVVEARMKSGSLITADMALEQGKDVYVVPGRIGDALSEGCNELIYQGASIIRDEKDILNTYRINQYITENKMINSDNHNKATIFNASKKDTEKQEKIRGYKENVLDDKNIFLASKKNMLYSELNLYPTSLDELIRRTGISIAETSGIILELELEGLIKEVSKNCYVRVHM